jgi:hypothetical protein
MEVFAVVSTAFPAPLDVDLKPATQEFQVALEGRNRYPQLPQEFLPRDDRLDLQHLLNSQYAFRLAHQTGHYIPRPMMLRCPSCQTPPPCSSDETIILSANPEQSETGASI